MKKFLFMGFIGIVFFTSGCGKNKLECSYTGTDTGKKIETKINVSFKDDKAYKVKEEIKMEFNDEYKNNIDSISNALEEQYKTYKEEDGFKVNITKGDSNIDVNIEIDVEKQKNKNVDGNIIDVEASRDDIKKDLEEAGYKCK